MPQDALALCTPEHRDLTVELVQGPHQLLHFRQFILKLLPHVSYRGAIALEGLPKPLSSSL